VGFVCSVVYICMHVDSSCNMMAHRDVREGSEGKISNAVCSQYSSHYLGICCIQHYYRWCAHLGCQQSTELTPTGRFKWTRPFGYKNEIWFICACAIHFRLSQLRLQFLYSLAGWSSGYCLVTTWLLPGKCLLTDWLLPGYCLVIV
jgi:hypothetical protein